MKTVKNFAIASVLASLGVLLLGASRHDERRDMEKWNDNLRRLQRQERNMIDDLRKLCESRGLVIGGAQVSGPPEFWCIPAPKATIPATDTSKPAPASQPTASEERK